MLWNERFVGLLDLVTNTRIEIIAAFSYLDSYINSRSFTGVTLNITHCKNSIFCPGDILPLRQQKHVNNSMLAQFCHLIYVAVDCFRTKPRFPMDLQGSGYAADCFLQFPSVTVIQNLPRPPGGRNGKQINMPGSAGYNTPLTCGF